MSTLKNKTKQNRLQRLKTSQTIVLIGKLSVGRCTLWMYNDSKMEIFVVMLRITQKVGRVHNDIPILHMSKPRLRKLTDLSQASWAHAPCSCSSALHCVIIILLRSYHRVQLTLELGSCLLFSNSAHLSLLWVPWSLHIRDGWHFCMLGPRM